MAFPAAFYLLFLLQQPGKGSIEGTVINSVTAKPIAGAQVQLILTGRVTRAPRLTAGTPSVAGVSSAGPPAVPSAITDANGNFAFMGIDEGAYLLRAAADGYATPGINSRPGSGMTAQVNVGEGAVLKDTILKLSPTGAVSGRVTAADGAPLVNFEVALLQPSYNPDGQKIYQQAGAAQTNDRGEYRIFWVNPGRYLLSVSASMRPQPGIPFRAGARNKYPRTFYPGTTDAGSASPVEVQAAADINGMDFHLTEQETHQVRGRVVDATGGPSPPRFAAVTITPREPAVNTSVYSGSVYHPNDGSFEFPDVGPGEYVVTAQLPLNGRPEPGQPPMPAFARAFVEVAGADLDGIVLTIEPPLSISGRIRIDGKMLPDDARASVSIRPSIIGMGPRQAQWNSNGAFRVDGVAPDEYRVDACCVAGQEQPVWLKEMWFGSVNILGQPFAIPSGTTDTLDIVFGQGAGDISGTLLSDGAAVSPSSLAVLIPDRRERRDLYRSTTVDSSGRFAFRSVPPGSYKIFAWADIDRNAWLDPDVLRSNEEYGTPVRVSESSSSTVEVRLIKN